MRWPDLIRFTFNVLNRQRFRAGMLLFSMAIGVCAVVTLTALGEGARQFVLQEFEALGRDTLVILPGRKETTGGMPPVTGASTRDITLGDAAAVKRFVSGVNDVAPLIIGDSELSFGSRARNVLVLGTSASFREIRGLSILAGENLPEMELDDPRAVAVIGEKVRKELFGSQRAIGQWIRAGDRRFRVIGILSGRGDSFGFDLSDGILVPVASAQQLFNREGLFRVLIEVKPGQGGEATRQEILDLMKKRHKGEEDVTLISPDALLSGFTSVLGTMTVAVAGIAGISLLVAGVMTMNIMLISVQRRVAEIGLLKALGAPASQVQRLFLAEAGLMSLAGALLGLVSGYLLILLGRNLYPDVPFQAPWWAVVAAVAVAVATGLLFALLPAHRAASLRPVEALTRQK